MMKPWQRGYSREHLDSILPKFDSWNHYISGPFKEAKVNNLPIWLENNQIKEFKNLVTYVSSVSKKNTPIKMYSGKVPIGLKEKNDLVINYISLSQTYSENNFSEVKEHFENLGQNVWFTIMREDKRICSILDSFCEDVGSSVDSFGNLFGHFFCGKRNHSEVSRLEKLTISELNIEKNLNPLLDSIRQKLDSLPAFSIHHSNYNKKTDKGKSWAGISLKGYSPDPSFIASPKEKKQVEKAKHRLFLQETNLMKDFPEVIEIIGLLGCDVERVRFMKLQSGEGELTRHTDLQDEVFGLDDGDVMRIHFPITTNPQVEFTMWNLEGIEEKHQMNIGKGYFLDTRKPHSAINGGEEERIHLVIDAYTNEHLLGLLTENKSNDVQRFYQFRKEAVVKTDKFGFRRDGEKIDREKMDSLKMELEQFVYNDNADKIIFGGDEKPEPHYKIFIDEQSWKNLKKKYAEKGANASLEGSKYLKLALSDLIDKYDIQIPFPKITLDEAKKDFIKLAHDKELFSGLSERHRELKDEARKKSNGKRKGFDNHPKFYALELLRTMKVIWYKGFEFEYESHGTSAKSEEPYEKTGFYISTYNVGMKASNYFHLKHRLNIASRHGITPYEKWAKDKSKGTGRKHLLGAFWSQDKELKHIDTGTLKKTFASRHYVASQFRPAAAKCLYRLFDAKNVFDCSMGWGDRLTAFLATPHTERYVGTDPNIKLHKEYEAQIELYGSALENVYGIKKKVEHLELPAEDIDYSKYKNNFDFIFSSPPYFDTEEYSDDEGQSYLNYDTVDSWLKNFMFKVIDGMWEALQDNGVIAINITDQRIKGSTIINKLCDPMNDHFASKKGASYIGCLGLEMTARPGQGEGTPPKGAVNCEPIWIWGKNNGGKVFQDYYEIKRKQGLTPVLSTNWKMEDEFLDDN